MIVATIVALSLIPVTDARPNIVLILADDLGYGSLGAYGEKEIPTPNIDSIAKNGAKMTNGYVSCPICAPTRAGLMTGRYQQRFGFEHNPGPARQANDSFGLPIDQTTIAEVLKKNGYRTGMFGKWHLGYKPELQPTARGFDEFYGFLSGARSHLPIRRADPILRGTKQVPDPEYLTEALAQEAVAFMGQKSDKPFFVYLPFNAVHAPMEAPAKYTDPFPELTGTRKTYAGMQAGLDAAVGKVLDAIKKKGVEKNTVVFFLSDNGGPTQQTTSSNKPLRGVKGQMYEGGIRVPFMVQWQGKVKPGTVVQDPCFSLDIFPTVLEIAGISKEEQKEKQDGRSLMPALQGSQSAKSPRAIFWRMGAQYAVRSGDWKMVSSRGRVELFNLKSDMAETSDLSVSEPEKLKELQALYAAWNKENKAPLWRRSDGSAAD
jgi:arylsulfatase A-like enzyme